MESGAVERIGGRWHNGSHGIQRKTVAALRSEAAERRTSRKTRAEASSCRPDPRFPDRSTQSQHRGNRSAEPQSHASPADRLRRGAAQSQQSEGLGLGTRAGNRPVHHRRHTRDHVRRVRADGLAVPSGPPPALHGQGGNGQMAADRQMVPAGRHAAGAAPRGQGQSHRGNVRGNPHLRPPADRMAGRHRDARSAKMADEHEKRRGRDRPRILTPTRLPGAAVLCRDLGRGQHQPLVAVAAQKRGDVLRRSARLRGPA